MVAQSQKRDNTKCHELLWEGCIPGSLSRVCQQGLLLDASAVGLRGGGWWKIADLIWVLSALSVRHNKIYLCTEKPIKAFVS